MEKFKLKEPVSFTIGDARLTVVALQLGEYANKAKAVICVFEDGDSSKLSSNVPERAHKLNVEEFFLKDWSENKEMADALDDAGVILPTGDSVHTAWVEAHVTVLNYDKLEKQDADSEADSD